MSITATTLSAAVTTTDQTITVASATGITAPNFQTGSGITWLRIDQELMLVLGVSGTLITVLRGQNGTPVQAHVINTGVQIGAPADIASFNTLLNNAVLVNQSVGGLNLPAVFLAGSADAIPAGVAATYIVKTAGVDAMTLAAPTAAQEGNVIAVYSDTTNAHTITATSLFASGASAGLKTTATFAAFKGAGVLLRCTNLLYTVMSQTGITFS